ncbi:unnamed protein product [Peniophora sp. CBMAI 1063]|nr:unnamed protein product [Peniophora sp. CBMAI 1063]
MEVEQDDEQVDLGNSKPPSFSRRKTSGNVQAEGSGTGPSDLTGDVQRSDRGSPTPVPVSPPSAEPPSPPAFIASPIDVPAWSADARVDVPWTPRRRDTERLAGLLSANAITAYAPGSADSAIRVFGYEEYAALSASEVRDIYAGHSILVRDGPVDGYWAWGLEAFSAIRPVIGTTLQVQDARGSFTSTNASSRLTNKITSTFVGTVDKTIPELVTAGLPSEDRDVYNCLDMPLGLDRLRNIPHIAGHGTFNALPYLYKIAARDDVLDVGACSSKLHWALAGVTGAETSQHIDSGGYGTVVEVLSGTKLWAVGVRNDGSSFANDTHCVVRADEFDDWQSLERLDMRWESILLRTGDIFIMRPGPHMVYTVESSLCYGEYFISPASLVDHATSFALTTVGDKIVTNDRIPEALPLYLAFASWWWHGDIACHGDVYDPSARSCRPPLEHDPASYIALLAMNVFQTTLSVATYDETQSSAKSKGVVIEATTGIIYREEAGRVHEWICRQGVIARKGMEVDLSHSDADRIKLLRDLVLDYGRGIYKLAVNHSDTYPNFAFASLRSRLLSDARGAYKVNVKDWLHNVGDERVPLIPDVVFLPSPRPDLKFAF